MLPEGGNSYGPCVGDFLSLSKKKSPMLAKVFGYFFIEKENAIRRKMY